MFTSPEQFANATKTLFDLQMQTFNTLADKTVKGVEQVVALNMNAAKNSMEGSIAASQQMAAGFAASGDPKAAIAALHARMQPGAAGAAEYRENLKAIIDEMHQEFRQAADTHVAEAKSTLSALIYDVTQNVKPGSENAVEIIKTAIDNAFKGYEQVTQATRQAVQTVEEQIAKASSMVQPGMQKPSEKPAE
ncbi:TIGR01841 family phasin [Massilia sp. IC2-476]|uniref:TIGR01841 family phasin n=1 Tax=Massilia sp. IC2-476 TaxID=2887199 RepID=UPI001D0FE16B|nr:TIGR01841 family phasin [Massilia sp. IC2-476]MCC2972470.1 TIGR01841 family phasin [Massilia sp. IC2-476]